MTSIENFPDRRCQDCSELVSCLSGNDRVVLVCILCKAHAFEITNTSSRSIALSTEAARQSEISYVAQSPSNTGIVQAALSYCPRATHVVLGSCQDCPVCKGVTNDLL